MPQTLEEKRERHREYMKKYRKENKDKLAEQKKAHNKKYLKENKEKIAEYKKRYNQENKEIIAEKKKKYFKENKEKIAEQRKRYRKENKEKIAEKKKRYYESKNGRERQWRIAGMKLFDDTYERYEEFKNCELCNVELTTKGKSRKVLDHDHDSGYVRFVCCNNCNTKLAVRDRMIYTLHLELYRYFNRK